MPPRPIYMTRSSFGFGGETVSVVAPFQSLRRRYERFYGIILPVCKVPDFLDFQAFSRK